MPSDAQTTISCNKLVLAYQVFGVEHALSTTEDGVLASIIGVVLRGDLEHGRHGHDVAVDGVPDELRHILVDQDDVDVIALDEAPEAFFDFADWCVFVDDHEVWVSVFVDFTDSAQQESNAGILVTDDAD